MEKDCRSLTAAPTGHDSYSTYMSECMSLKPYSCADRPELRISLEGLCNRSIAFVVAGARVTSIDALNDHTQLSALLRIKQRVRKVIVDNCKRELMTF